MNSSVFEESVRRAFKLDEKKVAFVLIFFEKEKIYVNRQVYI